MEKLHRRRYKPDIVIHHIMKTAGTSLIRMLYDAKLRFHCRPHYFAGMNLMGCFRHNNQNILYNNTVDYRILTRNYAIENSLHLILIRDPIERFFSMLNHMRVLEFKETKSTGNKVELNGGDWSIFHLGSVGVEIESNNVDKQIQTIIDTQKYLDLLLNARENDAHGTSQYSMLKNLQYRAKNKAYLKLEEFDTEYKKYFPRLKLRKDNVTADDLKELGLIKWKYNDLSDEYKMKVKILFIDEYNMLNSEGIVYNIP